MRISRKDKKMTIEGLGVPKLIHVLPESPPVTGIDWYEFNVSEQIEKIMKDLGVLTINQLQLAKEKAISMNQMDYADAKPRRFLVLITSLSGASVIEGRGASAADVILAANDESIIQISSGKITL